MLGQNPQRRGTARNLPKFLCCSMYCLFCVVLCTVCVCVCTVQLPPGGYPIAVNKYRVSRNDCRGDQMLLARPPRSPDATPCDFFLWGYVKDQVYVPPLPASIPELKVQIRTTIETITADMPQTVWNELDYRVDVCRITEGAHIEHL